MSTTRLQIETMAENSSGRYLIFNEAMFIIDAVLGGIIDATRVTDSGLLPSDGDAYRLASAGTPADGWSAFSNNDIVIYINNGWTAITPSASTNYFHFNNDTGNFEYWNGTAWATALTTPAIASPGSSTDNGVVRWNGTSGDTAADSGVVIDDDDLVSGAGTTIRTISGTTHTLEAADIGKTLVFTNGAAITLTLPQQSTLTTVAGYQCNIIQAGAGAISYAIEGAETLESKGTASNGQHSAFTIIRRTTTAWGVYGDVT